MSPAQSAVVTGCADYIVSNTTPWMSELGMFGLYGTLGIKDMVILMFAMVSSIRQCTPLFGFAF